MPQPNHAHHQEHPHGGHESHSHGHAFDQGLTGFLRYLTVLPRMWRSPVSTAVVVMIAPQRGETVLEIGAGMGPAAVLAARSGAHVVAVDPTPYMRDILALRSLAHGGAKRISVANGSAEAIPAADGGIDALWTVNTMHHWGDLEKALREAGRVLRPGGRLVWVDEDFENPEHPSHAEFARRAAKHGHAFTQVDPEQLAERLVKAGFAAAEGSMDWVAGRPARVVRATR